MQKGGWQSRRKVPGKLTGRSEGREGERHTGGNVYTGMETVVFASE